MPEISSSLEHFFSMGFTILGDSRDFANGSIQVTLARGNERLIWTYPLRQGVIGVSSSDGVSYLKATPDQISFDVVTPVRTVKKETIKEEASGV